MKIECYSNSDCPRCVSLAGITIGIALGIVGCEAPVSPETTVTASASSLPACSSVQDLVITNGNIITVDPDDSIVSSLRIRQDRIIDVGNDLSVQDCDQVIDVEGRTVVPGLQDNHTHYLRAGMRPGYDARAVETARSIAELQTVIAERAAGLPAATDDLAGKEFIAIIDAWDPSQFTERRVPTRAELDEAAPDNAVYMMVYPFGPGVTNSIGKQFLETAGILVSDAGLIAGQPGPSETDAQRAYAVLKENQTLEDKKRSLREFMQYSNTVGLTTVLEGGGDFPGPGVFDETRDYEAIMALWREGELTVRLRAHFQTRARSTGGIEAIQQRVDNTFMGLGDDMFKVSGLGENVVAETTPIQPLELFVDAYTIAAQNGWRVHQHSVDLEELETHTSAFEIVNETYPIADLRWNLSHVQEINDDILERLRTIGAGVAAQVNWYHGNFTMGDLGPPFRKILDSGVHMSGGGDATAFTPWVWLYHMTTGRTSYGDPILGDQAITRMEALRIATLGTAWDVLEENDLGSIEPGKLADIVVLSEDYLTVPNERFRNLRSVLTLIGGEIVYSDGSVVSCGTSGPWFKTMSGMMPCEL